MNEPTPSPQQPEQPEQPQPNGDATQPSAEQPAREPRPRVFGRFAFWIVAFPFIYYLLGTGVGGYLEKLRVAYLKGELDQHHNEEEARLPVAEEVDISKIEVDPNERFLLGLLPLGRDSFPYTYTFNVAVTTAIVLLVGWGYFRAPFRISWWSLAVGVVGIVVWIALAYFDEHYLGLAKKLSSGRPGFNPFEQLKDQPRWMWQFVAIRFFGLVVLIPLIEEFFVRGFLMRYVDDPDWDEVPLGQAKTGGWIAPTVYGVVAHMTEPLSALVWFTMVSWLYKKTGSVWDCVVAHAVTNLLLGLYIVKFGAWQLW